MKKLNYILIVLFAITFTSCKSQIFAREVIEFKVEGICEMCKDRIETALDVKGVKVARWNVETKVCQVVFNPRKISRLEVHQLVARAGHSTDRVKATDNAYNSIHKCCRYREMDTH